MMGVAVRRRLFAAWAAACAAATLAPVAARADGLPTVGLIESIPIMGNNTKVAARPLYVFTNQKLTAPTVFTGLAGSYSFEAVCCYEVRDITPVSLDKEIARYPLSTYSYADDFGEHLKGIQGYAYIYALEPVRDSRRWSKMMRLWMKEANDPDDAVPYSVPAVAAQLPGDKVPATFTVDGVPLTVTMDYVKKTGRNVFTFKQGKQVLKISEPGFPD